MFKLKLIFVAFATGLIILLVSQGQISQDFAMGWGVGIAIGVGFSEVVQRLRR